MGFAHANGLRQLPRQPLPRQRSAACGAGRLELRRQQGRHSTNRLDSSLAARLWQLRAPSGQSWRWATDIRTYRLLRYRLYTAMVDPAPVSGGRRGRLMRLRLTYLAVGIVITLGASALIYQLGFGPGKLHATRPQASIAPIAVSPVVSPRPALLTAAWIGYKHRFIQPDGRVIDFQRDQVTTSEGQSYAMLRAVWMDDRPTFDLTWRWTRDNLGDPTRSRFGWLWGKAPDGSWRLLDANSASDADEDIALALLFASHQWSPSYRPAAIALLDRIWGEEVATVAGQPYLTAGNWGPRAPLGGACRYLVPGLAGVHRCTPRQRRRPTAPQLVRSRRRHRCCAPGAGHVSRQRLWIRCLPRHVAGGSRRPLESRAASAALSQLYHNGSARFMAPAGQTRIGIWS